MPIYLRKFYLKTLQKTIDKENTPKNIEQNSNTIQRPPFKK